MARKTLPVAVHLFLRKDNQILLLRRFNTGYEDGNYSVIAGHIDGGEDVYAAMIREAKEEAGISIALEDLKIVQVMHRKTADDERIDYFFECTKWHGEIVITEPDKCDRLDWFSLTDLPSNTIDYIYEASKRYSEGMPFTIFGW